MDRPIFKHLKNDLDILIPSVRTMVMTNTGNVTDYGSINRVEFNGKRWYEAKNIQTSLPVKVPSVTTILDSIPNPSLEKWKKRVGKKEADTISQAAKNQGTSLHSAIEAYLNNEPNFPADTPQNVIDLFRKIQPALNRIQNIQMLEKPLICPTHAGTPDCIADFDKMGSIIDFKQSHRSVRNDTLEKYFLQTSGYQQLWFHRYPNWFNHISYERVPLRRIIIVAVENQPEPEIFSSNLEFQIDCLDRLDSNDFFMKEWKKMLKNYWDNNATI